MVTISWEKVESQNSSEYIYRSKVPGGWLIKCVDDVPSRTPGVQGKPGYEWRSSISFYPDPSHVWGQENIHADLPESPVTFKPSRIGDLIESVEEKLPVGQLAFYQDLQNRINEFMKMNMEPFNPGTISVKGIQPDGNILLTHHPLLDSEIISLKQVIEQLNYTMEGQTADGLSTYIKMDITCLPQIGQDDKHPYMAIIMPSTVATHADGSPFQVDPKFKKVPIYDTITATIAQAIEGYDTTSILSADVIKILSKEEVGVDIGINQDRKPFMLGEDLQWHPIELLPAKEVPEDAWRYNSETDWKKDKYEVCRRIQAGISTRVMTDIHFHINDDNHTHITHDGKKTTILDIGGYRLHHDRPLTKKEKSALVNTLAELEFKVRKDNDTNSIVIIPVNA